MSSLNLYANLIFQSEDLAAEVETLVRKKAPMPSAQAPDLEQAVLNSDYFLEDMDRFGCTVHFALLGSSTGFEYDKWVKGMRKIVTLAGIVETINDQVGEGSVFSFAAGKRSSQRKVQSIFKEYSPAFAVYDAIETETEKRAIVLVKSEKFDATVWRGRNLVGMACQERMHKLVACMLDNGFDVNLADGKCDFEEEEQYRTPLHWAADVGSIKLVRLLLDAGADVHARAGGELQPLHLAVYRRESQKRSREDTKVVEALISAGANVNATIAFNGLPALFLPLMKKNKGITRILIENGANIEATCDTGGNALWYGYSETVDGFLGDLPLLRPTDAYSESDALNFTEAVLHMDFERILEFMDNNSSDLWQERLLAISGDLGEREINKLMAGDFSKHTSIATIFLQIIAPRFRTCRKTHWRIFAILKNKCPEQIDKIEQECEEALSELKTLSVKLEKYCDGRTYWKYDENNKEASFGHLFEDFDLDLRKSLLSGFRNTTMTEWCKKNLAIYIAPLKEDLLPIWIEPQCICFYNADEPEEIYGPERDKKATMHHKNGRWIFSAG